MAIQEPYNSNGIRGLGISTKIISDTKSFSKVPKDNDIKAAIAIAYPDIRALKLEHLCNTILMCAKLRTTTTGFYMVSVYFQCSEPIIVYIRHFEEILQALHGQEIILCLDANASSTILHSKAINRKGKQLGSLTQQHRLSVVNTPQRSTTFDNNHGNSNIDVTLGTNAVPKQLGNWKVRQHQTTSDRNLITFELTRATQDIIARCNNRFNIKRANW